MPYPPIQVPAKVNLFLEVLPPRKDGYHDLISLIVPLAHGDRLTIRQCRAGETDRLRVIGLDPGCDPEENLVMRALRLWREASPGQAPPLDILLEKRIPPETGFGGGSADATTLLRWLDFQFGEGGALAGRLASKLGSDCPVFLHDGPVLVSGRGDLCAPVPEEKWVAFHRWQWVLFAPTFGVSTAWAFSRMRARGGDYASAPEVRARYEAWLCGELDLEALVSNNMELAVGEKFLSLPVLHQELRNKTGHSIRMSGSGSGSFALVPKGQSTRFLREQVFEAYGPNAFWVETVPFEHHSF